jgi:hypothetical protein
MSTPATWLDVVMASVMALVLVTVIVSRILVKRAGGKGGLSVRVIQFTAVGMIIPAVVLLALHGKLQGEAVAAIVGGLIGYLLSNIAKFDEREND